MCGYVWAGEGGGALEQSLQMSYGYMEPSLCRCLAVHIIDNNSVVPNFK